MLTAGSRLGHYEVLSLLGAGGMGEVYRARDLTLGRDVAIKVVTPSALDGSAGPARFEREARVLAALNHPQIASVYGVVEAAGTRGLVMELVEGPTLDEIIGRDLTVDRALSIARQLADALEAAHEQGIVHRDLKPGNIKVTTAGAVKVLDFGIAKALIPHLGDAPTVEVTQQGAIIGTAAYMSPEQARGQHVDARTDIWAFGAVLYEMLSHRRAFTGASTTDVLASVLTREPDWTAVPASVPSAIVRLLHRCLQKDAARRLRHIGDARFEIEDAIAAPVDRGAAPVRSRRWISRIVTAALVAGALLAVAVAKFGTHAFDRATGIVSPVVSGMPEPPGELLYLFADPIKLSPDGTRVAFVTNSAAGRPRLWMRALNASAPEPIDGGEGGMYPFWSPDSRSLGFVAQGQLKTIDLTSHAVTIVAPAPGPIGGGSWSRGGVVVFADASGGGLKQVAATGGVVKAATTLDSSHGDMFHVSPYFLPDGEHFLYFVANASPGLSRIMIGALDGSEPRRLMASESMAVYADPGYLLSGRGSELVAQAFDTTDFSLRGDPIVIGNDLWMWKNGGIFVASASRTGVLMFATRRKVRTQLTWFDRNGRPEGVLGDSGEWVHVAIAPDERTVAAERLDGRTGQGTIWMLDVGRNVPTRLTSDPGWSLAPTWSPDSRQVVFGSSRESASDLYIRAADGSGADEVLSKSSDLKTPTDWTRDGRILFNNVSGAGSDIWTVTVASDHRAAHVVEGTFNEGSGKISPDGRWLAYVSNESGRPEVYVRSLAGAGRWTVSANGGWQPRWRRDGKELFFIAGDWTLMAVPITPGAVFTAGKPEVLPITVQPDVTGWRYGYDVAALGRRFLVNRQAGTDSTPPITVVTNWTGLLRK